MSQEVRRSRRLTKAAVSSLIKSIKTQAHGDELTKRILKLAEVRINIVNPQGAVEREEAAVLLLDSDEVVP